jgi:hypothetical protein
MSVPTLRVPLSADGDAFGDRSQSTAHPLRRIAAEALSAYPVELGAMRLLGAAENVTFRVDTPDGERLGSASIAPLGRRSIPSEPEPR